jgi:hypothetical protein
MVGKCRSIPQSLTGKPRRRHGLPARFQGNRILDLSSEVIPWVPATRDAGSAPATTGNDLRENAAALRPPVAAANDAGRHFHVQVPAPQPHYTQG